MTIISGFKLIINDLTWLKVVQVVITTDIFTWTFLALRQYGYMIIIVVIISTIAVQPSHTRPQACKPTLCKERTGSSATFSLHYYSYLQYCWHLQYYCHLQYYSHTQCYSHSGSYSHWQCYHTHNFTTSRSLISIFSTRVCGMHRTCEWLGSAR